LTILQLVANFETRWAQDVSLFTIVIVQQRDSSIPVGVILNRGDRRGNAIFVSLEVNDSILLLVTTTTVTRCLSPMSVSTTGLRLRREQ
jgi:hypothetical protein